MSEKPRPHCKIFTQPSMTQQHQKDETDVNKIMKRYVKTGVIDHVNKHAPRYGDVLADDYRSALHQIMNADDMFQELPSEVRKRFDNDPAQFLDFVQDPVNADNLHQVLQPGGQSPPGDAPQPPPGQPPVEPPGSGRGATNEPAAAAEASAD